MVLAASDSDEQRYFEFKISHSQRGQIYIGVCTAKAALKGNLGSSPDGWSYLCGDGTLYHRDRRMGKLNILAGVGDRVGIMIHSGTLNYFINGVPTGVVFDNIPTDQDLYAAVSFWDEGDEISLEHDHLNPEFHHYPQKL